jgi:hypothetical protein
MGEHHVPLQIDENNNVTKVGHDMGGSYEIKETVQLELFPNDMKGSSESREHISIPKHYIKTYSNDMELGAKIRQFYYENY